ncbi:hypothetical protein AAE478_001499 [Parahypoxylon ruwenzoriense]
MAEHRLQHQVYPTLVLREVQHGRQPTLLPFSCVECTESFANNNQLRAHGLQNAHQPYGCICGTRFTRLDALSRHISSQSSAAPQYPCDYCNNHRREKAFRRLDDLVQHMKGYHKITNADKLPKRRDRASRLVTAVHTTPATFDMPPFPSLTPGRPGWEMDGYSRQVDVVEHQAMMRPFDIQNMIASQLPVNMTMSAFTGAALPELPDMLQAFPPNDGLYQMF